MTYDFEKLASYMIHVEDNFEFLTGQITRSVLDYCIKDGLHYTNQLYALKIADTAEH